MSAHRLCRARPVWPFALKPSFAWEPSFCAFVVVLGTARATSSLPKLFRPVSGNS